MKLFIPRVGDKIKLLENWSCSIESESRNQKIFDALGITRDGEVSGTAISISLPKETVLRMDRLYVRAPASNYDSITFTVEESPLPGLDKARFWVKITEANQIECEPFFQDKTKIKKLTELFNVLANELNIDLQHLTVTDNDIIIEEMVKNEPKYTLNMKVPTVALEQHIGNMYARREWVNGAFTRITSDDEVNQVKEFFKKNNFPQYLDINVEISYLLGNVIYKNKNTKYTNLIEEYRKDKNERYKTKLQFFNEHWEDFDPKKEYLSNRDFFGPEHLSLAKESPKEVFESWNATINNENGESQEITTFKDLLNNIVKWNKESKKVKVKKMKP